jgi:hypothetical protein
MPSNLELTTSENLKELADFLLEVFRLGKGAPMVRPDMMRWKFFDPRPDWDGPRSYLMFRDGRIFAHGCVVPEIFRAPNGRVTSMRVIDWAGSRHVPAAGVLVMQKLSQLTDTVLAIGGSPDAIRTLPRIKFEHRGDVDVFVRVLKPWRQFRTDPFPRGWKAPLRLARNTLRSFRPVPSAPFGWTATEVKRFDDILSPALIFQPKSFTTTERSVAMLNYMLSCPDGAHAGFVLRQGQQVRGHAILSHILGQTRIAEVWVNSEALEDWQAAFDLATLQASAKKETCEILAVSSIAPGREALRRNGYLFCRKDPIFILDPKQKLAGAPEVNLNMFAGDASYLCVPTYPYET